MLQLCDCHIQGREQNPDLQPSAAQVSWHTSSNKNTVNVKAPLKIQQRPKISLAVSEGLQKITLTLEVSVGKGDTQPRTTESKHFKIRLSVSEGYQRDCHHRHSHEEGVGRVAVLRIVLQGSRQQLLERDVDHDPRSEAVEDGIGCRSQHLSKDQPSQQSAQGLGKAGHKGPEECLALRAGRLLDRCCHGQAFGDVVHGDGESHCRPEFGIRHRRNKGGDAFGKVVQGHSDPGKKGHLQHVHLLGPAEGLLTGTRSALHDFRSGSICHNNFIDYAITPVENALTKLFNHNGEQNSCEGHQRPQQESTPLGEVGVLETLGRHIEDLCEGHVNHHTSS